MTAGGDVGGLEKLRSRSPRFSFLAAEKKVAPSIKNRRNRKNKRPLVSHLPGELYKEDDC